jgi:hypothetical protein
MTAGSPAAAGHPARPGPGWRATAAGRVRRVAIAGVRLAVSFTGWVGAAVLVARYLTFRWWGFLPFMALFIAGVVIFLLPLRAELADHREGRRVAVFWTFRALAVAGAYVLFVVLSIALQNQEMQKHGVVERAVVTGESTTVMNSDCCTSYDYYYSLRALAGPAIRGTLEGPSTLSVGERVTVLADPSGRDGPTLSTGVSANGQLLAAEVLAGAEALLFAVTAWTWPPSVRPR